MVLNAKYWQKLICFCQNKILFEFSGCWCYCYIAWISDSQEVISPAHTDRVSTQDTCGLSFGNMHFVSVDYYLTIFDPNPNQLDFISISSALENVYNIDKLLNSSMALVRLTILSDLIKTFSTEYSLFVCFFFLPLETPTSLCC